MIYFISTFFSMFFSKFAYNSKKPFCKKNKNQIIFAIISALPFIIVAGFRYNVGCDFMSYVRYFDFFKYTSIHKMEFGFNFLIEFIQLFSNNNMWLFLLCAIIFIFFTYKAIYQQSIDPTLSIFLLLSTTYFTTYLNGMRQLMAIAIFLYAIKYIKNRDFSKYILFIIIACMFHTSSILYIPLYFLYGIKIKPKTQLIILLICFVLKSSIFKILNNIFLLSRYSIYNEVFAARDANTILIVIEISTLLFALYFYKRKSNDYSDNDYNLFCIIK